MHVRFDPLTSRNGPPPCGQSRPFSRMSGSGHAWPEADRQKAIKAMWKRRTATTMSNTDGSHGVRLDRSCSLHLGADRYFATPDDDRVFTQPPPIAAEEVGGRDVRFRGAAPLDW